MSAARIPPIPHSRNAVAAGLARRAARCGALLALALCAPPAEGVLLTRQPGARPLPLALEESRRFGEGALVTESSDLPLAAVTNLSIFRRRWEHFAREEQYATSSVWKGNASAPKRNIPRMVLGIFTRLDQKDESFREVIRDTWMQQPYICYLAGVHGKSLGKKEECRVFVTFVAGQEQGNDRRNRSRVITDSDEDDVTVLPLPENLDCGKSWAWFHHASRKYPWATHVAKMDMDAFLHVSKLLDVLRNFHNRCPHVYGGRSWYCRTQPEFCPPQDCGLPQGADFFKYTNSTNPSCWSYMQGGFYFLSRELASTISEEKGWWHRRSTGCYPEDALTGKVIDNWSRTQYPHPCVAIINMRDTGVYWHPDIANYWRAPLHPLPDDAESLQVLTKRRRRRKRRVQEQEAALSEDDETESSTA